MIGCKYIPNQIMRFIDVDGASALQSSSSSLVSLDFALGAFASCFCQSCLATSLSRSAKWISNTSEYQLAAWPSMPFLMFCGGRVSHGEWPETRQFASLTSGSSSQSDMLSAGNMIFFAPARRAATVFSRRPPMRNTLPVTVSSPVMAMVGSRG